MDENLRVYHVKKAKFVTSAVKPGQYPEEGIPEIAFAGRSNVGKSSLINRLVNRKRLVKTGSTPGKTRLINFFSIDDRFLFVDLPGFGYARVPKDVRRGWKKMVEAYFAKRQSLISVVLIMDIRRDPGELEERMKGYISQMGLRPIYVLTKADKISRSKQLSARRASAERLSVSPQDLILFSAKTGQGKDELWQAVLSLI